MPPRTDCSAGTSCGGVRSNSTAPPPLCRWACVGSSTTPSLTLRPSLRAGARRGARHPLGRRPSRQFYRQSRAGLDVSRGPVASPCGRCCGEGGDRSVAICGGSWGRPVQDAAVRPTSLLPPAHRLIPSLWTKKVRPPRCPVTDGDWTVTQAGPDRRAPGLGAPGRRGSGHAVSRAPGTDRTPVGRRPAGPRRSRARGVSPRPAAPRSHLAAVIVSGPRAPGPRAAADRQRCAVLPGSAA